MCSESPVEPVFETKRLYAHPWSMDLVESAFRIYSDPTVTRFIGGAAEDSLDSMRQRLESIIQRNERLDPMGSWAVFLRTSGELVGTALLKPLPDTDGSFTDDIEIGWHLARDHWHRGYATEFGQALVKMGFEQLRLPQLHAVVDALNAASMKVALRLGMRHIGTTTKYYDGQSLDHFVIDPVA